MSDEASLEEALDGILDAVAYAESIGEYELSGNLAALYQDLAKSSPNHHWENVYYYRTFGQNLEKTLETTEGVVLCNEVSENEFRFYATEVGIENLRDQENLSDLEVECLSDTL